MDKLKTIMAVKKTVKDYQAADRLETQLKKSEKLILQIQKVVTKADTINKIIKVNADPKDELITTSNEFKNKSLDLNERIAPIKQSIEKIEKALRCTN